MWTLPKQRNRPAANEAASDVNNGDESTLPQRIDNTVHDVLLDALLAGERLWWLKRAEDFERAKPRPGEYHGAATEAELSAQWQRLDRIARACRARAEVSPVDHIREDIAAVLAEVAA